jgi:hypothetical protein
MNNFLTLMISLAVLAANPAFAMEDEIDTVSKGSSRQTPLKPLPPYDWSNNFHMTITPQAEVGNQVLHTKSTNKPYRNSPEAIEFVNAHLSRTMPLISDADVLKYGVEVASQTNGCFTEMGVGMGRTINFIAALNPTKTIYGFDSFEGLPEDWDKGDKTFPKGMFAVKEPTYLPPLLNNIRVYKGLFADVLPQFKEHILGDTPIAFLHMDCDSYTPAKDVFTALGKNIIPGTVIVFDELYNYPNYAQHEWKALQEFLENTGYEVDFLAFNANHEQVVVQIK